MDNKLKSIILPLAFLLLFLPGCLHSQSDTIRFKQISLKEGLSQSAVYCILQDKKGFMWFCTQEGLNRYDGYEFKCYKHYSDDLTSISDSYIWCVIEGKSGLIWIGTNDGGLNSFDPTTEQFTSYRHDPNNDFSLSHDYVRTIFEDHEGVMWIGTYGGGLNTFDPITKRFSHYEYEKDNPKSISNNNVTSIYEDHSGTLWVGTDGGGINLYKRETDRFIKYKHNEKKPNSLSNNNVLCMLEDRSGTLWIGTQGGGLDKFDGNTGRFEHFTAGEGKNKLSHNNVLCLFEDQYGILWIGTEGGGLNTFDRKTGLFTSYIHNAAIPDSLSNDVVRSILEDNSGVIWIGTNSDGLNKYNPRSNQFALYQQNVAATSSLSSNDIRAIYEDKPGVLWIGTYGGGLNKFDPKTKKFTPFKQDTKNPLSLTHNDIRCILEDRSGILWIGTRGGGVNKMVDRKNGRFKYYKNDPSDLNSISNDSIRAIYEDRFGDLWIGTEGGGLNKLIDKNKNHFERYQHDPNNPNSLSNDIVFSIFEDRSGILWIGTRVGGLNKFNRERDNFTAYKQKEGVKNSLSHNFVLSIYEDRSGILWIGTYGGGLNKMIDREKGIFESYREKDGLPNDVIYGILEDSQGNLWLSTNRGISRFAPLKKTFRNYDVEDGLQSNEFNSGAYLKSSTGEIFFGGVNGFNVFYPDKIKDNFYDPPVVITDFFIANKSMKPKWKDGKSPLNNSITESKEIKLEPQQNFFSFAFSALNYANPNRNKYRYKLDGLDKNWIETDSKNRRATYTNLSAGDYVFRFQGSNKDNVWNEKGASIIVKILPPFWKTRWAYILYIISGAIIMYLLWAAWSKRILKQRVESRTKELNEKNHFLEKINLIVRSINSEMEFGDLLYAILRETRSMKAVEKASALVLDTDTMLFNFKASSGWDIEKIENIKMTSDEVEERYIKNSTEIYNDIFIAKGVNSRPFSEKIQDLDIPKAMLITCIRCNEKYEAYFIFDNMHDENAFDDEDILLLKSLKEHFVAAFQKARLISQLKSTQVQLIQSEKMRALGDLVANVAHELNNPASFIQTTSYNLHRDLDKLKAFILELAGEDADKEILDEFSEKFVILVKHLNTLKEGITRIDETVKNLRTFSRMDKNEMKLVNIQEGLQATLNLVKTKYKEDVDFITDFQPSLEVKGNPAELNQVFMNLLTNGCYAILEKQKLSGEETDKKFTILMREEIGYTVIVFQDTGTGMTKEVKEKMFDPFFTTKPMGEGTGLGLSISYSIIKKHNGHIKVESEIGKGTAVTLYLPRERKNKTTSEGR